MAPSNNDNESVSSTTSAALAEYPIPSKLLDYVDERLWGKLAKFNPDNHTEIEANTIISYLVETYTAKELTGTIL